METKIILDTSILVDFIRNREDAISYVRDLSEKHDVWTTDINVFELYYGAYLTKHPDKNAAAVKGMVSNLNVFSTTQESMEIAGKLFADLEKKGQKIELRDVMIAGICLLNSCPVATHNKKHFERMNVKIAE